MDESPILGLAIADDDLLVFIDETGHESLTGDAPIFGIGGIAVYGADYEASVAQPWLEIRACIGLAPDCPLHAATDFSVYKEHLDLLQRFFETGIFVRHAAMVTTTTTSTHSPFITASCAGLARNVGRTLARVVRNSPVTRVVYVVEHSERLHSAYQSLVGPDVPTLEAQDGRRVTFQQQWAAMRKSSCIPGLEVADFVLHAAYGQVRARMQRADVPYRRDFQAIFRSVHRDHVEYMEINSAEGVAADGPPGTFRIGLQ
jgi:hypothetical protein